MCVIVVKPAGVKLGKAYWRECFRMNGHGAGLSYVEDNKLVVDKGYFDFDKLYSEIEKNEEKEMVVHFRVSSAGPINAENCHPFFVKSENFPKYSWAISHNGTLDFPSSKDESDTNLFVKAVLGPQLDMHPWFLDNYPGQHFLKAACKSKWTSGNDSKMVVFRYDNEAKQSKIYIANKALGIEDMGCWFSNASYRLPVVYHSYHRGGMGFMGDYEVEDERFFAKTGFPSEKDWSRHGYHKNELGRWVSNRYRSSKLRMQGNLPPSVPLLQQQEQQKNIAALVKSDSSGSNISVPRDDEVRAERNREIRFNSRLDHLTKKEKKIIRRLASDYARATIPANKMGAMNLSDMVQDFRDTVRYASPNQDVMSMEDKLLDKWIVDQYWKCNTDETLNLNAQLGLESDDPSPRDIHEGDAPDDIDEAIAADARLGHNVEQFPLDGGHGDPINV